MHYAASDEVEADGDDGDEAPPPPPPSAEPHVRDGPDVAAATVIEELEAASLPSSHQ